MKRFSEKLLKMGLPMEQGRLVTFGIPPTRPETGFGYIQTIDEVTENIKSSKIKKFVEKPELKIAEKTFRNKHYL